MSKFVGNLSEAQSMLASLDSPADDHSLPGLDSDVYFGDPNEPLPNWREELDEEDDDDELSPEEREAVIGLIGFDPSDDEDEIELDEEYDDTNEKSLKPLIINKAGYALLRSALTSEFSQTKSLNPPSIRNKTGYTGQKEDALGRTQCYQDGQHVACDASSSDTDTEESGSSRVEQINNAIKSNAYSPEQVAQATGVPLAYVKRHFAYLLKSGMAKKVGLHKVQLDPMGVAAYQNTRKFLNKLKAKIESKQPLTEEEAKTAPEHLKKLTTWQLNQFLSRIKTVQLGKVSKTTRDAIIASLLGLAKKTNSPEIKQAISSYLDKFAKKPKTSIGDSPHWLTKASEEAINNFFGKKVDKDTLGAISNNWDGGTITASFDGSNHLALQTTTNNQVSATRTITKLPGGEIYIHNDYFKIVDKAKRDKGWGLELFVSQVKALKEAGVSYIETDAAGKWGDPIFNGYYTWPRFGYNAEIPYSVKQKMSAEMKLALNGKDTVLDLMEVPGGRDFWKKNGTTLYKAKFDLKDGSRSMKVLEAYLKEREEESAKKQPGKSFGASYSRTTGGNGYFAKGDLSSDRRRATAESGASNQTRGIDARNGDVRGSSGNRGLAPSFLLAAMMQAEIDNDHTTVESLSQLDPTVVESLVQQNVTEQKSLHLWWRKSLTPPRVKEGFTGQKEDSLGRTNCYQDGKKVPCTDGGNSGSSAGAPPAGASQVDKMNYYLKNGYHSAGALAQATGLSVAATKKHLAYLLTSGMGKAGPNGSVKLDPEGVAAYKKAQQLLKNVQKKLNKGQMLTALEIGELPNALNKLTTWQLNQFLKKIKNLPSVSAAGGKFDQAVLKLLNFVKGGSSSTPIKPLPPTEENEEFEFPQGASSPWSPTPQPEQGQVSAGEVAASPPESTDDFPENLDSLETVKQLGGSTGAKLVKDENGEKYVWKKGKSPAHIKEEVTADKMYEAMGIPVQGCKLYDSAEGPIKLKKWKEGKPLKEWMNSASEEQKQSMFKQIQKGFVMDCVMANWDVIGLGFDNILVDNDGKAWRIDNGGSLRYRAQGSTKTAYQFSASVSEIDTMRNPSTNPSASFVYSSITDQEIKNQIDQVVSKKAQILSTIPDNTLRQKISERIDWLKENYKPQVISGEPQDIPNSMYFGLGADWPTTPPVAGKVFSLPSNEKFKTYSDTDIRTNQTLPTSFKTYQKQVLESLTTTEKSKVKSYTGSAYFSWNTTMRQCPKTLDCNGPEKKKSIEAVEKAIAKAGVLKEPITVWRSIGVHSQSEVNKLLTEAKKAITTGKDLRMPGFKSTSTSPRSGSVVFEIKARTGLWVKPISYHSGENEFLQGHNVRYRVTGVKKVKVGYSVGYSEQQVIQLEEIIGG